MSCTVFIDESGDTGIIKVRSDGKPGASPYFVMAAAVLQPSAQIQSKQLLHRLEVEFGKSWAHATDLNHAQKVYLSRQLSQIPSRFFAVISKKDTLRDYANEIDWDPHKFYNKCAHYLLEKVGSYLASIDNTLTEPTVVFEDRNHDFDKLRRYLGKIKDTPFHTEAKGLAAINPFGVINKKKNEEFLLKIADVVSHAVYQCVNKTPKNYHIPEPRYLRELGGNFACDHRGSVLGTGIKCIHELSDLKLDGDIERVLSSLRAFPPRTR